MDQPVDGRDEDTAKERGHSPHRTADEKRLAAKMTPHEAGICKDGECEPDMHNGSEQPDGQNPGDAKVTGKRTVQ
jgi:hypothetical protein